jgi:RNA polymerase sigma-70 factor (ECF subfamily)
MELRTQPVPQKATSVLGQVAVSDAQLELQGLQSLDSQAIGAVFDRYFSDVYRFVYYRLSDEQAAEDISSDVFVRLLEAVNKGRGPQTNLKGWLLATAAHAVADYHRHAYRRPTEELTESLLDGSVSSLDDESEQRERVAWLRLAYDRLTPEQQNVLALRFGDGYSLEETAQVMQKNVNAIKALQFRALAALQRLIRTVTHE